MNSDNLYSIFDKKLGEFSTPFIAKNKEHAKRIITTNLLTDQNSNLNRFPDDFTIETVCLFNVETGKVEYIDEHETFELAELFEKEEKS